MSESVLTLDQPIIDRLLQSSIAKMIPCLQRPPKEYQPTCGGCTTSSSLDYNNIKDCLMGSSAGDLSLIKTHLGVSKLRFKKQIMVGGQPNIETVTR
mgnify:CR=1 FL=1